MLKKYDELEFTDDFMFSKIMYNNPETCKQVLELILNKHVDSIDFLNKQESQDIRYYSKGVRFDVYIENENTVYDIEMQVKQKDFSPKRCRYYHSMIDISQLRKGSSYQSLKESYVIFICKNGVSPIKNEPICSYQMRCDQSSDIILSDDSHTVVVNAKTPYTSPSETVQSFLRYIRTGKADGTSPLTDELSKLVKEAKEDKRWSVEYMTLEMKEQEWRAEAKAEGRAEARQRAFR